MAIVTVGQMIKRLAGLHDTKDVSPWENTFIGDIMQKTNNGDQTKHLSGNQVDKIEQIHSKHFG